MLNKRVRLIGVLALVAASLSCGGGSSVAYNQGRKAENRKDWDTALVDYEKAKESDPANSLYVLHEQNARTHASLVHLKNGRQMLKEGRLDEAAGELQKAARIDPANRAAAQELERPSGQAGAGKKGTHRGNRKGSEGPRRRKPARRGKAATPSRRASCPLSPLRRQP